MGGYFRKPRNNNAQRAALFLLASLFAFLFVGTAAFFLFNHALFDSGSTGVGPSKIVVEDSRASYKMINVLVPVADIKQGQRLTLDLFQPKEKPEFGLDSNVVTEFAQLEGMFAKSILIAGQTFTQSHLQSEPNISQLVAKIPSGYRAITINVDMTTSVEGWAMAGSLVDVLWHTRIRGDDAMVTIVENAKILSVGGRMEKSEDAKQPPPSTVTVLVTSKDATKIALAQKTGTLSLALRGTDDAGLSDGEGIVSKQELQGGQPNQNRIAPDIKGTVMIDGTKYLVKAGGEMEPIK